MKTIDNFRIIDLRNWNNTRVRLIADTLSPTYITVFQSDDRPGPLSESHHVIGVHNAWGTRIAVEDIAELLSELQNNPDEG